MAYFGFGGGAGGRVARSAGNGARKSAAKVAATSYGSASTKAGTKAPHIPTGDAIGEMAIAGAGQRFPFITRVVGVPTE